MEDKLPLKEYFSKEFFENILENNSKIENSKISHGGKILVDNLEISVGGGMGENYTSDIIKAKISYRSKSNLNRKAKEVFFLIKNVQTEGENREVLRILDVFGREVSMFTETVPKMEALLSDGTKLVPRCFYTDSSPYQIEVFEDMSISGYRNAERMDGLDEEHVKLVLSKLAKFHASSMVLAINEPQIMEKYKDGLFTEEMENVKIHRTFFLDNQVYIINMLKKMPHYETLAKKLQNLHDHFYEKCLNTFYKSNFKVLNHGDMWVNNLLFKYDKDDKPCDVQFVDLQISVYSSPGIDIQYLFNTSLQLNVLQTKRYALLHFYYEEFRKSLERFKYDCIPTWEEMKNEIHSQELYGFMSFATIFPIITLDRESSKDSSIDTFGDSEKMERNRQLMFSSKRFQETMLHSMNRFDELGLFD